MFTTTRNEYRIIGFLSWISHGSASTRGNDGDLGTQKLLKKQNGRTSIKKLSVNYSVSLYDDGQIFINMTAKSTAKLYSRFSLEIILKDCDDETLHSIITPVKNVKVGATEQFNETQHIPSALAREVDLIQVGGQEGASGMTNEAACILL